MFVGSWSLVEAAGTMPGGSEVVQKVHGRVDTADQYCGCYKCSYEDVRWIIKMQFNLLGVPWQGNPQ